MDDQPTKICRVCGGEFTYDKLKKDKRKTGGVDAMCKECHNVSTRAYKRLRRSDPELRALDNEKARVSQGNKYHNDIDYKTKTLELRRLKYANDLEFREQEKEKARLYRANMDDEQYAKSIQSKRKWEKNNPEYAVLKTQKRKTAKRNLPNDFTVNDAGFALDFFNYLCAYCGCELDTTFKSKSSQKLFWEHIVPLTPNYELKQPNPGTVPANMIPCCQHCNDSKGSNEQRAWLVKTFGQQRTLEIEDGINEYKTHVRVINS